MSRPTVILSVDDDAVNQTVIEILLDGSGYQVLQAMDGVEALEVLEKCGDNLPDLALVDVMMPRMSGYELCRKLRELYPPFLPIIMISAKSSKEDIRQGLECRCNDYVTKPFDKEELLARIETLIKLNRMRAVQEREECMRAVEKISLPPQLLTLPESFEAIAVSALVNDSMKPFIEYLAKKFELMPVPNRIGGVFTALSLEQDIHQLVPFVNSILEHCHETQPVTCLVTRGHCRKIEFGTDNVSEAIIPSVVFYGPVMDTLTQLMGVRSTFSLSGIGQSLLVTTPDICDDVIKEFGDSLHLIERLPTCVILSPNARTHVAVQTEREQIPMVPVGRAMMDGEIETLMAEKRSLVEQLVDKTVMSDVEELERTVHRFSEQIKFLENEYRQKSFSVNDKLKSVLNQESFNEVLFLELKRRQFENSPFRS